jgi:hypothetical protein
MEMASPTKRSCGSEQIRSIRIRTETASRTALKSPWGRILWTQTASPIYELQAFSQDRSWIYTIWQFSSSRLIKWFILHKELNMMRKCLRSIGAIGLPCFALFIFGSKQGYAQSFSSGSTGADGPLNLTTPGTILFDPSALGLKPTVPNVFNFTTINIAAGVTVTFSSKNLTGPVYWLAQDGVTISGTLILDGEPGAGVGNFVSARIPSAAGPGGFGGGVGGGGGLAPQPGNGPGAGAAATTQRGGNGTFTGSQYLIPLIGGSGGGGGLNGAACNTTFAGAGGAGGGAILIASSVTITIGGTEGGGIFARDGLSSCNGGGGSGGAIRLVANTVTTFTANGSPTLDVTGSGGGPQPVSGGQIRVEAFTPNVIPGGNAFINGPFITSVPYSLAIPSTGPSTLKVTSLVVGGVTIPINANPFSFPDATINASGPVTVNVQAQYIPQGTIPMIIVMSETGPDNIVPCSALQGTTIQQTTCSASITFPTGGSRGFVKATWTQ